MVEGTGKEEEVKEGEVCVGWRAAGDETGSYVVGEATSSSIPSPPIYELNTLVDLERLPTVVEAPPLDSFEFDLVRREFLRVNILLRCETALEKFDGDLTSTKEESKETVESRGRRTGYEGAVKVREGSVGRGRSGTEREAGCGR